MSVREIVYKNPGNYKREVNWLYYLDKNCNVTRSKMVRGGARRKKEDKPEVVYKTDIPGREEGYLYFIDKGMNVARTKMSRGGVAVLKKREP